MGHGQPNQFGDGARLHPLHEPGSAVFDGSDAEAQVAGDLLVRLAVENQVEDLALVPLRAGVDERGARDLGSIPRQPTTAIISTS